MHAWALWSTRVDMYSRWELVEIFLDEETANRVRAELIGKPSAPGVSRTGLLWNDDDDFPDLCVRSIELR